MTRNSKTVLICVLWLFLLAIVVLTFAQEAAGKSVRSRSGVVVSLSDIHFNPFFDPKLIASLARSDYSKWQAIFEESTVSGYAPRGADSNYILLRSALDNVYRVTPHPDFIVISGDFLAHDFQEKFASFSGSSNPEALRSFINKTIAFMTSLIANRFPGTAVYPVLGNNDADCGDYQLEPDGPFLRDTLATWKVWFQDRTSLRDFARTFPARGSYSVLIREHPQHRIIVLNTTLFSINYRNTCGKRSDDPAGHEIKWLGAELRKAADRKQKIWLVYHIPPGIDVYATLARQQNNPADRPVVPLWQPTYNEQFITLLQRYSATIVGSFAGHLHMDTFELLQSRFNRPISFVHVTPAISPVYGNNPAFEVSVYDRRTFDVTDYTTYFLDLDSPEAKTNVPITWRREYSFKDAYGQRKFGASALNEVHNLMPNDQHGVLTKYEEYYDSSNPAVSVVNQNTWRAFWCGMTNLTVSAYANCMRMN